MRHNLGVSSNSDAAATELIFETGVNALGSGALAKTNAFMRSKHGLLRTSLLTIHYGHVSQPLAELSNVLGIVAFVHQVVKTGDALCRHFGQRNRYLAVLQRCRSQHRSDGNLTIGDVHVRLVADPVARKTLAIHLAAFVAMSRHL